MGWDSKSIKFSIQFSFKKGKKVTSLFVTLIPSLNMLYKLWVQEGEAGELILVEVHHEEFVRGS